MRLSFRSIATLTLVAASAAGVACSDSTEPEPEPEVATMRLIVGGTDTIEVGSGGAVTGGPITIAANTSIVVEWLRDDGTEDPVVTATDFELSVTVDDETVVTFTRSSAFAGTLNKVAAGSTSAEFGLFHIEEQHDDFGPFPVAITVN
jgi:hypothetical protein